MDAKKCDRCGKLYESYSVSIRFDMGDNSQYRVNGFMTGANGYMNNFKDLCPECMKSFTEWFNAPKVQGKEQDEVCTAK